MKIIGTVGTAKNTGKTTTLSALLNESARLHETIGVTGIGYDGEEIDTVTGLPKPRLLLQPGTIVVTSERCLEHTTSAYRVIMRTDEETALGPVSIVEIVQRGMMVLAGPNTKRMLGSVLPQMRELGITRFFVDGSLNRIAAMSVVDTMIFTTGASRSTEISFLSEESRSIIRLFDRPALALPEDAPTDVCALVDRSGAVTPVPEIRSLYDADDARTVINRLTDTTVLISIPNMLSLQALETLARSRRETPGHALTIAVNDATIMLLAGDPISCLRVLDAASAQGGGLSIAYRHSIRAVAMTVNPFYPRQQDHAFVPAYIDKSALLDAVSAAVGVPVFNIREGASPSSLFSLL